MVRGTFGRGQVMLNGVCVVKDELLVRKDLSMFWYFDRNVLKYFKNWFIQRKRIAILLQFSRCPFLFFILANLSQTSVKL